MTIDDSYSVAALSGENGTSAKWVEISSNAGNAFTKSKSQSSYTPTSIVLTANCFGFTGTSFKWYKNGTEISGATSSTYTVTAQENATYKVTVDDECSDQFSIFKLTDGTDGTSPYNFMCANENISVACNKDGKPLSATAYRVDFSGYHGTTKMTPVATTPTAKDNFTISKPTVTGFTVSNVTADSTAKTVYVTLTTSTTTAIGDNTEVSFTITYHNGSTTVTEVKKVTLSAAKQGITGDQGTKTFYSDYSPRNWTDANWATYSKLNFPGSWNNTTTSGMRIGDTFIITATLTERGNCSAQVIAQITSIPTSKETSGYYKIGAKTVSSSIGEKGQTGTRGSLEFSGTEIYSKRNGANTECITTASAGISSNTMGILAGDTYINSLTQDVWKCTAAGTPCTVASDGTKTAGTATWTWQERRVTNIDDNNLWRFFSPDTRYEAKASCFTVSAVTGTNPFGEQDTLMKVYAADGGTKGKGTSVTPYNKTFAVDISKSYRYVCFIKQSTIENTSDYFGLKGYTGDTGDVNIETLEGTKVSSGYFTSAKNLGTAGKWYMIVSYIMASGSTSAPKDAGVYDVSEGKRIKDVIAYRWRSDSSSSITHNGTLVGFNRADTTVAIEKYIYDLRFDVIDGNEPTVDELLHKPSSVRTIKFGERKITSTQAVVHYYVGRTADWTNTETLAVNKGDSLILNVTNTDTGRTGVLTMIANESTNDSIMSKTSTVNTTITSMAWNPIPAQRNLCRNGDFAAGALNWTLDGASGAFKTANQSSYVNNFITVTPTDSNEKKSRAWVALPSNLTSGSTYTISFYAYSGTAGAELYVGRAGVDYSSKIILTSSWVKYTVTLTVTGSSNAISFYSNTTSTFFGLTQVKVELGDQATDWIAFPGDDRGCGSYKATTEPSSSTKSVWGVTPAYLITLANAKSQTGEGSIFVGDVLTIGYYTYKVVMVDDTNVYLAARTSIRGATGANAVTYEIDCPMVFKKAGTVTFNFFKVENGTRTAVSVYHYAEYTTNGSTWSKFGESGKKGTSFTTTALNSSIKVRCRIYNVDSPTIGTTAPVDDEYSSLVSDGADGTSATAVYLGNENITLACDKDGKLKEAFSSTVTVGAYTGTSRKASTITNSSASSNITVGTITNGTTSADGSVSLTMKEGTAATAGNVVLSIVANGITFSKTVNISVAKDGQTGEQGLSVNENLSDGNRLQANKYSGGIMGTTWVFSDGEYCSSQDALSTTRDLYTPYVPIKNGEQITVSFEYKTASVGAYKAYLYNGSTKLTTHNLTKDKSEWTKFTYTYTAGDDINLKLGISNYSSTEEGTKEIHVRKLKIEYGPDATAFCYSANETVGDSYSVSVGMTVISNGTLTVNVYKNGALCTDTVYLGIKKCISGEWSDSSWTGASISTGTYTNNYGTEGLTAYNVKVCSDSGLKKVLCENETHVGDTGEQGDTYTADINISKPTAGGIITVNAYKNGVKLTGTAYCTLQSSVAGGTWSDSSVISTLTNGTATYTLTGNYSNGFAYRIYIYSDSAKKNLLCTATCSCSPTGNKALQPKKNWSGTYTTVGATTICKLSVFNRTPVVGDTFTNIDGSSNTGTWEVTAISTENATIKLLSYVNSKGKDGGYQDYQFAVGPFGLTNKDDLVALEWHDAPPETTADNPCVYMATKWIGD